MVLATLLALAPVPVVIESPQDPPRPGFRHVDEGFAGTFRNAAADQLRLQVAGDRVTGTLSHGAEYRIAARLVDGAVRGGATVPAGVTTFSCTRNGEDLDVKLGDATFSVRRVVEPLAALVDLGAPVAAADRRWTVAIYFGADNNLEQGALGDLAELRAIQALPGVEVVAFVDRWRGKPADPANDWTDCRVLHLRPGQEPEVLLQPGELASNDPATLAGFLIGACRKFPSRHRAAILWDHGGGWFGMISDDEPKGRAHAGAMRMGQVRQALRTAMLAGGGDRFDLVVADACLMAQLDSALSLHGLCDVLVASQTEVAGTGLPYGPVMAAFAAERGEPAAVATAIVAAFESFYRQTDPDPDATLAAIKVDEVPAVARHLDQLAGSLLPHVDAGWPRVLRALWYAESDELAGLRAEPDAPCSLDVVDVVQRIAHGWPGFPGEAAQLLLETAVRRAVFARGRGDSRGLSRGLAVFGPRRRDQAAKSYAGTPLGAGNRWWELVTRAHEAAAADGAPLQLGDLAIRRFGGEPATEVRPFDGTALHFTATGNSLVSAQQWDLLRDEQAKLWVILRKNFVADPTWPQRAARLVAAEQDLLMPQFVDGRNELRSELLGLSWSIQNETMRVRPTIDLTGDNSSVPITARALLRQPGDAEPRRVEVAFGRASWTVERVHLLAAPAAGLADRTVKPEAGSTFTFLLEAVGDDGKRQEIECEPIRYERGLRLVLSADEPGQWKAIVLADTLGGRRVADEIDYRLVANPDLDAWTKNWQGFEPGMLRGTWSHGVATGPGRQRDTGAEVEFVEQLSPGKPIWRVKRKLAATAGGGEYQQTWILDLAGVPNLRILTPMPDSRTFCWFGPATWTTRDDRPALVMKAVNVDSGLWVFQQSLLDSLRLRDK